MFPQPDEFKVPLLRRLSEQRSRPPQKEVRSEFVINSFPKFPGTQKNFQLFGSGREPGDVRCRLGSVEESSSMGVLSSFPSLIWLTLSVSPRGAK